ncbi:hypothetical protein D3C85_1459510 [compost metagenome]
MLHIIAENLHPVFYLGIVLSCGEQGGIAHQQQLPLHHERHSLRFLHDRLHRRLGKIKGNNSKIPVLFGNQVLLQKGRKFIHPELLAPVQHIEWRNFPLSDVFGRRFGIHPATSFSL